MDAVADPQKKFSHSFLGSKTRFESIMVTNPFFLMFRISCLKLTTRKGQNGHFLDGPKMSKIRGAKLDIF